MYLTHSSTHVWFYWPSSFITINNKPIFRIHLHFCKVINFSVVVVRFIYFMELSLLSSSSPSSSVVKISCFYSNAINLTKFLADTFTEFPMCARVFCCLKSDAEHEKCIKYEFIKNKFSFSSYSTTAKKNPMLTWNWQKKYILV